MARCSGAPLLSSGKVLHPQAKVPAGLVRSRHAVPVYRVNTEGAHREGFSMLGCPPNCRAPPALGDWPTCWARVGSQQRLPRARLTATAACLEPCSVELFQWHSGGQYLGRRSSHPKVTQKAGFRAQLPPPLQCPWGGPWKGPGSSAGKGAFCDDSVAALGFVIGTRRIVALARATCQPGREGPFEAPVLSAGEQPPFLPSTASLPWLFPGPLVWCFLLQGQAATD